MHRTRDQIFRIFRNIPEYSGNGYSGIFRNIPDRNIYPLPSLGPASGPKAAGTSPPHLGSTGLKKARATAQKPPGLGGCRRMPPCCTTPRFKRCFWQRACIAGKARPPSARHRTAVTQCGPLPQREEAAQRKRSCGGGGLRQAGSSVGTAVDARRKLRVHPSWCKHEWKPPRQIPNRRMALEEKSQLA
jgi:hypothetical protein